MDVLDRVDQHEGYDPVSHYKLELDDARLTAQELAARHGRVGEDDAQVESAVDEGQGGRGTAPGRPQAGAPAPAPADAPAGAPAGAPARAPAPAKAARRLEG